VDPVQPVLGLPDRDRWQLRDLAPPRLGRVAQLRLAEHMCARPTALRPMVDDLVDLLGRKQPPVPALMPRLATTPPTRTLSARTRRRRWRILRRRRDEFRELRLSRRSSSATRASSRWFASTSSPTRNNNATAVSRSPSRIASASARSTAQDSPPAHGSLPRERLPFLLLTAAGSGPCCSSSSFGPSSAGSPDGSVGRAARREEEI
jgi:hypothetical protein